MDEKNLRKFKMILFGDEMVGKTAITDRFVNNKFENDYIALLSYNVFEKRIEFGEYEVALIIFDIGGQEQFKN